MSGIGGQEQSEQWGRQALFLLSAEALAGRMGFSVRTIWRLKSTGKLPKPLSVGGSVRWRSDEIDAWIRAGCPDAEAWEARRRERDSVVSR